MDIVPPAGAPCHILVVDDHEAVRRALARLLRSRGFEVTEAGDGLEALSVLERIHADAIVTDLNMPRCDGEELCSTLQSRDATSHIPILLVTGADCDQRRLLRLGCRAVLQKPVLPAHLFSAVESLLAAA